MACAAVDRLGWVSTGALAAALLAASAGAASAQAPGGSGSLQEVQCQALAQPGRFPATTVASAKLVPAGGGAPAHCEVTATISPVAGSRIGVVYRLPGDWNGKIVGYGGGGWAGNVRLETAATDLSRGYATLQTDGGHPSANAGDASWTAPGGVPNDVALRDFAYRAVHEMTGVGKQVVAAFYGRPQTRAYFQGCSTGGRMALMEAQRFPEDYDGIVSGAPVYSLRVQVAEIYRDWIFAQPGAAITPRHIGLVHDAVLSACDAKDGVKDGILNDPRTCAFDPAVLACKSGQQPEQCLSPAQVEAFRRQYTEVRGQGGAVYVFPYPRGTEPGWLQALNITADPQRAARARNLDLRAFMFGDPNFDFAKLDVVRDTPRVRSTEFAKYYEADNPDIRPFLNRGGKLILWHGFDDQLPSAFGTIDYYQRMRAATGAAGAAGTRFFLAPGVLHCGGGPGANTFDFIAAVDAWVERGTAPERIKGERAARATPAGADAPGVGPRGSAPAPQQPQAPPMTRPICAYPALPAYRGQGDANDERSFDCR